MSAIVVEGRIQSKIDTKSNWNKTNPVLLNGELAIESDTHYVKVGNGSNHYNDLPYLTTPLKVDSQVTTNSNNLITSGAVSTAISNTYTKAETEDKIKTLAPSPFNTDKQLVFPSGTKMWVE